MRLGPAPGGISVTGSGPHGIDEEVGSAKTIMPGGADTLYRPDRGAPSTDASLTRRTEVEIANNAGALLVELYPR